MNAVISMSGIGMRPCMKAPCVVTAISAAYLPASAPNPEKIEFEATGPRSDAAAAESRR